MAMLKVAEAVKLDGAQKRQARLQGERPPQARRSASAIMREATEAHRAKVGAKLRELRAAG